MLRYLVLAIALLGCADKKRSHDIDHDLIRVTNDARLRTDKIGDGDHTDTATFVLVEAENTAKEGAYVTLGGELTDEHGATVGTLRAQSLYIPSGEKRTFALTDKDRKPRPTAKGAKIRVRGARVPAMPPPARVEGIRAIKDGDKTVVQGVLKNEGKRGGDIMVIATFYDRDGKPMTRPFSMVWVPPNATQPVQFVGPPGSVRGTIFVGDLAY